MNLKINISFMIILLMCIYAVDRVRCVCDSNTLRDIAVEACNRITKRSVDLNDFYNVEHIYPKDSIHHRHARKLTRSDFPKGAYLLIKPHKKVFDNSINEDDSEEAQANEILTEDMQGTSRNHKNRHSFRFTRNTVDSFTIEHCCSKANIDVCGRYFCH